MANPQKEDGYTGIANEILDAILSRQFTKRQDRILMIVFRFSYGFSKKTAFVEQLKDFSMYGLHSSVIKAELKTLEERHVIEVDWHTGEIKFVKDYTKWEVELNKLFKAERHKRLVYLNVAGSESERNPGWNARNRGGGRPRQEKPLGLQGANQLGLQNTNQLGYSFTNQQVTVSQTKTMPKFNDSAKPQGQKETRKQGVHKLSENYPPNNNNNVTDPIPKTQENVVVPLNDHFRFLSEEEQGAINGMVSNIQELNGKCLVSNDSDWIHNKLCNLIEKHEFKRVVDIVADIQAQFFRNPALVNKPMARIISACNDPDYICMENKKQQ